MAVQVSLFGADALEDGEVDLKISVRQMHIRIDDHKLPARGDTVTVMVKGEVTFIGRGTEEKSSPYVIRLRGDDLTLKT